MAKITRVKSARERRNADGTLKPNHICEFHQEPIKPGDSYKWISVMTSPRSSHSRYRCDSAPDWHRWDYSSSLSARVEQVQYEFSKAVEGAETKEDIEQVLAETAESIREIAEEKRDSAQNMEDGFGHPTEKSDELNETADELDSWADDVESANIEDAPDEDDFDEGADDMEQTAEEAYQEALEQWQEEARSTAQEFVDQSPV